MIHRWVFRSFLCFWPFILYHKLVSYSKHGTKKMRFLLCSKHRRIRHFDLNCFLYDWLGTEIWCQCFILCSVHHVHSMGMNRVEECQTIESISLGPHVHHAQNIAHTQKLCKKFNDMSPKTGIQMVNRIFIWLKYSMCHLNSRSCRLKLLFSFYHVIFCVQMGNWAIFCHMIIPIIIFRSWLG